MKRRPRFAKRAAQFLTLVSTLFFKNDLLTYAAAGSYGFLCSLVPVIMLIAGILIRFFKTTPDSLIDVLNQTSIMQAFDLQNVLGSILSVKKAGIFEIIITVFILLMARRFFNYLTRGFRQIFRDAVPQRPLLAGIITFSSEVLLVLGVALLVFVLNVFQTFINVTGLVTYAPWFLKKSGELFLNVIPVAAMFLIITMFYHFVPGSKPKFSYCAFFSVLCTFSFWIFDIFFHLFLNMGRYNVVYGVLSNLIVLLLEVYVFFILLLFFAECIFVRQFYEILSFEQLYLLPPENSRTPLDAFTRVLFKEPESVLDAVEINLQKGQNVYESDTKSGCIYYVASGQISYFENNHIEYYSAGTFFGEIDCLTKRKRKSAAVAETDAKLFCISYETFRDLLDFSSDSNKKMVETMNAFYNRTNTSAE
ncbi:MAG: YihY/virulence factor BrkB family protein [Spirochaetaceae bacterium]|nr:YihY/virulence factor BrkB family protein [Spirochaetaceae bacterium]